MNLKPILTIVEKAAQDAMRKTGRELLKRSNELAPVDDRDLIKSGKVVVDDLSVTVRYTAPHAVFQHEHLDWEHDDGGSAKFLERASDEIDIGAAVAEAVREALG
ncbi:HK97 gp10 family phage protein [Microbacterium aurantiacum]|uniref:HK97 gp10 family phage protein n=1 Tax=Microbacterium aurantiacum TaxID=162393 RepID=UPI000C7FF6BB|nr:HK97 gp10 family phage protein [Microbacterium aurantiacum]